MVRSASSSPSDLIIAGAHDQRLDSLVLHASQDGRTLYEQFDFKASNEVRFISRRFGAT